jgi:prophage DNA circulation protein
MKISTVDRIVRVALAVWAFSSLISTDVRAQDVPGIEICTVEKTMERRTSCLQSNVDFLQKTITKLGLDYQQKFDAANRQIDGLNRTVIGLQKAVNDLEAMQKKTTDDQKKKAETSPAKDNATKDAKDVK